MIKRDSTSVGLTIKANTKREESEATFIQQGDYASGLRTLPSSEEGPDYARGLRTLPRGEDEGPDYARGLRKGRRDIRIRSDFARGQHTSERLAHMN